MVFYAVCKYVVVVGNDVLDKVVDVVPLLGSFVGEFENVFG